MLITAGATRNPIDAVRFLSAKSTGRTGVAIAGALRARGAHVTFFGSPEACMRARLASVDADVVEFGSTRDLMTKMEQWVRATPTGDVVHAAAVGDYECATSASKVPSGRQLWHLPLTPTPKIADRVRGWGQTGRYVTFKAAAPGTSSEGVVELATAQRIRTRCDLVFANVLGRLDDGLILVGEGVAHVRRRDEAIAALVQFLAGEV